MKDLTNFLLENFQDYKQQINACKKIFLQELQFRAKFDKKDVANTLKKVNGEVAPNLAIGLIEFQDFAKTASRIQDRTSQVMMMKHFVNASKSYKTGVKVYQTLADDVDTLNIDTISKCFVATIYFGKLFDLHIQTLQKMQSNQYFFEKEF